MIVAFMLPLLAALGVQAIPAEPHYFMDQVGAVLCSRLSAALSPLVTQNRWRSHLAHLLCDSGWITSPLIHVHSLSAIT